MDVQTSVIMGCVGLIGIVISFYISHANFIMKTISTIGLFVFEIVLVIGVTSYLKATSGNPDALYIAISLGGVVAGGCRIGNGAFGRIFNKPAFTKWLFSCVGWIMFFLGIILAVIVN